MVEDLEEVFGVQVVLGQQIEGVLRPEVFPAGACRPLAIDRIHVSQLELDHVGS